LQIATAAMTGDKVNRDNGLARCLLAGMCHRSSVGRLPIETPSCAPDIRGFPYALEHRQNRFLLRAAGEALSRVANGLKDIDAVIISAEQSPEQMAQAWF
jgi:hypothetical protein